jgi:hypothetical protein|tara:strand:+ start:720 stop:1340 length:621 start_codon:yes stop_codon:yes gene_type:complete
MALQEIEIKNQEILDHLGKMEGPIPGQSLTSNPDEPKPWERPPTHTKLNEALYSLFEMMTEEEMYIDIVSALGGGMPVVNLTRMILTDGFQKGAWNPDLMVQLIEPTMYMVMSMAEKAGVKYRIDDEDDPDMEEATPEEGLTALQGLANVAEERLQSNKKEPEKILPRELLKEIEAIEVPQSLLEQNIETEEPTGNDTSLLARGEM